MTSALRPLAVAALLAVAACSGVASRHDVPMLPAAAVSQPMTVPAGNYIKHVVIIVQENRSFENVFAGWPGADAPMTGQALTKHGVKTVRLTPIGFVKGGLGHQWIDGINNWDGGKMDGFENNHLSRNRRAGTYAYSYLRHDLIKPYRAMASQYVLADHMFPSMFGPSFTAHLTLVSSMTNEAPDKAIVDVPSGTPWGCDAPLGTESATINPKRVISVRTGGFPCYTQFTTMADTLDEKGVSWKYYAPNILDYPAWSAFDAIKNVRYGPDWAKVITPEWQVLLDAKNGALPAFSWVTPDAQDSDHPGDGSDTGPSWVGSVVNAIGNSPYWDSTAIFVVWDDWGGWYDNVPPPQLDFKGLGIRVPCLIISPFAKKGYVSHVPYEFGSILHFSEQVFGLRALGPASAGYTDQRANTMLDAFDFTQPPRPYVHIGTPYPKSFFMNHPQSMRAPDDV